MKTPFKPEGELVKDYGKVFLASFKEFDAFITINSVLKEHYDSDSSNYIFEIMTGEEAGTYRELFFKMASATETSDRDTLGYRRMLFVLSGTDAVNMPSLMQKSEPQPTMRLTSLETMELLKVGTKLTRIFQGEKSSHIFAGIQPNSILTFMAVDPNTHLVKSFTLDQEPLDPAEGEVWLLGYNSQKVGEIRIAQLEHKIDTIRKIYLKERVN